MPPHKKTALYERRCPHAANLLSPVTVSGQAPCGGLIPPRKASHSGVPFLPATPVYRLHDELCNDTQQPFYGLENRNEYIVRLCSYPLLILDDFGMERGTEYGLEQVYNVIDSRYISKRPLIATTNLTPEQKKERLKELMMENKTVQAEGADL